MPQYHQQPIAQYTPHPKNSKNKNKKPLIIILISAILVITLAGAGVFFLLNNRSENQSSTDSLNPPLVLPSCDKTNPAAQADLPAGKNVETVKFAETDAYKAAIATAQKLLQKAAKSISCNWQLDNTAKVVQSINQIKSSEQEPLIQELRKNPEFVETKQADTIIFMPAKKQTETAEPAPEKQAITYISQGNSLTVLATPASDAGYYAKSAATAVTAITSPGYDPAAAAPQPKPLALPTCDKISPAFERAYDAYRGPNAPPEYRYENLKDRLKPKESQFSDISRVISGLSGHSETVTEVLKKSPQNRFCVWPIGVGRGGPHPGGMVTISAVSREDRKKLISAYKTKEIRSIVNGVAQIETNITYTQTDYQGATMLKPNDHKFGVPL
ncbi:MAG: hypothetical protein Q4C71_02720, partial [Microbacteriaceae bacterium]|nr:hypothetical protein [Microbacteriaceae bacterium]